MSLVPPIVSPLLPGALYGVNDPANGPDSGYYRSWITDTAFRRCGNLTY